MLSLPVLLRILVVEWLLLCGLVLFVAMAELFPAVEEDTTWQALRSQPSAENLNRYLDGCRACLYRTQALDAIDRHDQASGRIAVLALERTKRGSEQVVLADLSPNGQLAVTTGWDQLSHWDTGTGQRGTRVIRQRKAPSLESLVLLPDQQGVATLEDGQLLLRDAQGEVRQRIAGPAGEVGHTGPRGLRAAPAAPPLRLTWQVEDSAVLWPGPQGDALPLPHPHIDLLGFDGPDRLVSLSRDGIRHWHSQDGRPLGQFPIESYAHTMALSADGRQAFLWGDTSLEVWDTRRGQRTHTLSTGETELRAICSQGLGAPVLMGSVSGELWLLAADHSTTLARWQAHRGAVNLLHCAAQSPRVLSVGHGGSQAKVWDLDHVLRAQAGLGGTTDTRAWPAGWASTEDWRAPAVARLKRWQVAERWPWLPAAFDDYLDEMPLLAIMGFLGGLLLLKLLNGSLFRRQ